MLEALYYSALVLAATIAMCFCEYRANKKLMRDMDEWHKKEMIKLGIHE